MLNKLIKTFLLLAGSLLSTTGFAHTGFHNDVFHPLFHPLSGVDHFLVVLIISAAAGVVLYLYKK